MIRFNQTVLPRQKAFWTQVQRIWENGQITNNGPLVRELESRLKALLRVKHLFLVSSGTVGLQLAIHALQLKGEIITTPFSFIATASSILWQHCQPVFVDIDPETWGMDPKHIENALSERTSGILPVHVFGVPCPIEQLQQIATQNNLKTLFDTAHGFGAIYGNRSLVSFGDCSILSFQAFKPFHTAEGGAIITEDDDLADRIFQMRYFGTDLAGNWNHLGTNAKLTELQAALGLASLDEFHENQLQRKEIHQHYRSCLDLDESSFQKQPDNYESNYAYFPIRFENEHTLVQVQHALAQNQVETKRYFFPPLHQYGLCIQEKEIPIAESVSRTVLCLPIWPGLKKDDIHLICQIINQVSA